MLDNFFNIGNKYKNLPLSFKLATPAYYRLSLQDLLLDIKKIIYLDGDTLIFEDLKELIELDMKGNVIMGLLDSIPTAIQSLGYTNDTVICSGVLLIDLDGLRKYGYSKKIEDFISKNRNKLIQHDQTIINVVMQDRIAPIPPKYGMWEAWKNEKEVKKRAKIIVEPIDEIELCAPEGAEHIAESIYSLKLYAQERSKIIAESIDSLELCAQERAENLFEPIDEIELASQERSKI